MRYGLSLIVLMMVGVASSCVVSVETPTGSPTFTSTVNGTPTATNLSTVTSTFTSTPDPTPTQEIWTEECYITVFNQNLRTLPSLDSEVVTILAPYTVVVAFPKVESDGFIQVDVLNTYYLGWLWENHLNRVTCP